MKKYKLKNGKKVKFGDTISRKMSVGDHICLYEAYEVTRENINELVKKGYIVETDDESEKKLTLVKVESHISHRTGMGINVVRNLINELYEISPNALFTMLLCEIADIINSRYSEPVSSCGHVWIINRIDGRPRGISTSRINDFRGFSAFRSEDDAMEAVEATGDLWDKLYGKQED